jgi:hypothetical protein
MSDAPRPAPESADWLRGGRGIGPSLVWSFVTEGPLTATTLARESGETFVADDTGMLCRLDRKGRIAAITRVHDPVRLLAWSDDGRFGAALCGEGTLHFFDHVLKSLWKVELRDVGLAVAVAPFGSHVFVGCADGSNLVYDSGKKRLASFETIRPLSFAQFVVGAPDVIACAEHGLVCRHRLYGEQLWNEKLWSNVGQLTVAGDGSRIHLACFNHGIQVLDGDGGNVGSYVLDGTVSRAAVSFEPNRIIAASVERSLYWLDSDGELLWATTAPADVHSLHCDGLGEWAVCGFTHGRVLRLDWAGSRPAVES